MKRSALLAGASVGAPVFADVSATIAAARAARLAYQRGETINTSLSGEYPVELPISTKGTGE